MKRLTSIFALAVMVFVFTACSGQGDDTTEATAAPTEQTDDSGAEDSRENEGDDMNILVAYFSRAGENYNVGVIEKGNTEKVAEIMAEETGGDLFTIETVESYPQGYDECTEVAQVEKAENARPELIANVENMADYDVIFLGYPSWWSDMPMAVYTFLEGYDFSGKTIVPFCTHEGSGLASTESSIEEVCSGAEVLGGLEMRGSVAQNQPEEAAAAVREWLAENGFVN
ncbi:MAG: flavodoxin [Bacillota bacterium]|nr:flavodoxin [Bacillota bacterium]